MLLWCGAVEHGVGAERGGGLLLPLSWRGSQAFGFEAPWRLADVFAGVEMML
jgi:hypothetical protein